MCLKHIPCASVHSANSRLVNSAPMSTTRVAGAPAQEFQSMSKHSVTLVVDLLRRSPTAWKWEAASTTFRAQYVVLTASIIWIRSAWTTSPKFRAFGKVAGRWVFTRLT